MNRRRSGSLASSPLLIGAVTTLIVVVAVYLSYNANSGLPFVPTYKIKVELPQTSGLESSNEVRIGGQRVGIVEKLEAHQNPATGQVTAVVFVSAEAGLVGVAAAVAARAVLAGLAARILVVASFVAAIPVLGEPLPRIATAGRGVIVVVLVVVVLHWSHTEVGLDLVQCAHRLTPSKALGVPVSVMKM